jgi:hypothetical protein
MFPAPTIPGRSARVAAWLALAALLHVGASSAAEPAGCRIAGDKVHWVADYCMARLETDDEIAAGACIDAELGKAFSSDCAAKVHYKTALCEAALSRSDRKDGIEACLADPAFAGSTVRNGGVGG